MRGKLFFFPCSGLPLRGLLGKEGHSSSQGHPGPASLFLFFSSLMQPSFGAVITFK